MGRGESEGGPSREGGRVGELENDGMPAHGLKRGCSSDTHTGVELLYCTLYCTDTGQALTMRLLSECAATRGVVAKMRAAKKPTAN